MCWRAAGSRTNSAPPRHLANQAGGEDNITVVLAQYPIPVERDECAGPAHGIQPSVRTRPCRET